MNLEIPPVAFYIFGALLVVAGSFRAWKLGWSQRPSAAGAAEAPDDSEGEGDGEGEGRARTSAAKPAYKRHLTFGALWVAMGLFVIITAISKARG